MPAYARYGANLGTEGTEAKQTSQANYGTDATRRKPNRSLAESSSSFL
jgi:hypothetical protein